MRIIIPFGKEKVRIDLSEKNLVSVCLPKKVKPILNLEQFLLEKLKKPIGKKNPLLNLNRNSKVAIVCDDYTRPTPSAEIIPILIKKLKEFSVDLDNIKIIIASGIHRKMTDSEVRKKIGDEIVNNFKIIQHDASNEERLVYLGESTYGTPVWMNAEVVNADFIIGLGVIEPHPYAGYGGGAKIIMPGIAGKESIYTHHGKWGCSPRACFGCTIGNPFWEDLNEIASMAGLDFIVNVILDHEDRIINLFAGVPKKTYIMGINFFNEIYRVEFDERVDVVLISANPKYWYFDMSVVAMLNAANIVKEGGTRIVLSASPEGLGPNNIEKLYKESLGKNISAEDYLCQIKNGKYNFELADAPAIYKLIKSIESSDIIYITKGLSKEEVENLGLKYSSDIYKAIKNVFEKYGPHVKIIVLPFGGYSLPTIKES